MNNKRKNDPQYHRLETRQLLAGISFDSTTGMITIAGSGGDDVVHVSPTTATEIRVTFENVDAQSFAVSQVTEIVFHGYDGDDFFQNDTNIRSQAFGDMGRDELIGGSNVDRFFGGDDKDVLVGNQGNDLLRGDGGDDTIHGGSGDDQLVGADGDDVLQGDDGSDILLGGAGRDELRGGAGSDQLYGLEDDDKLWGDAGDDLLIGQAGKDKLFGGPGHDELIGSAGDDELIGGDGADRIVGGDGDDILFGEAGTDVLLGQQGNDFISGGDLSDTIFGGPGNDRIFGNEGNDQIWGNEGDDQIDGQEGDDLLVGESGADRILGGNGNDLLFGGLNDDFLDAGPGEDIALGNEGMDTLLGGPGRDRLFGNLDNDWLLGGDGDDDLFGNSGDDVLQGGAGDDLALGHEGRDRLLGESGDDTAYGGDGDDILRGGPGSDRLFGQAGNDYVNGDEDEDIVHGGAGADVLDGGPDTDDVYATDEDSVFRDDGDASNRSESPVGRPVGLSDRLTVSFAPNGTPIFDQFSTLFSAFSNVLTETQIRESVLGGLQLWASQGNLNIGVVGDSGDPFGIAGKSFGDPRFGDIRVGAIPMPGGVNAVALGQGDFVAGTWAGDILFNSNAVFKNPEQFFAVALHEVGHVLGLKHNNDPGSTMHRLSNRTTLAAQDIANLRGLYGQRKLDPHEDNSGNDSIANATRIEFAGDGTVGTYPAVIYGDIANSADVDVFEFRSPSGYEGPVTFRVVTDGISLMETQVSLLDQNGNLLAESNSQNRFGDVVEITTNASSTVDRLFVKVDGLNPQSVGSFALVSTLDDRNTISQSEIMSVARSRELQELDQQDIATYFADPAAFLLNEDGHSDDVPTSAIELQTEDGFEANSRYETRASLADANDVDFYRFRSIDFGSTQPMVMIISVRAVEFGGMAPNLKLTDTAGNPVESQVVVNGHGEMTIQVSNFQASTDYLLSIQSDRLLAFTSGNYELTISHSAAPLVFRELATGTFDSDTRKLHSLHVAESQIFQFGLEADNPGGNSPALIWVTIYDDAGQIVHQSATRGGERRTSRAAFLEPGSYTIEIEAGVNSSFTGLSYKFLGIDVGDSQGPVFNDPTNKPFEQNQDGTYKYPDNVVSDLNFVVVDGVSSNQNEPPGEPPPTNLYLWYWGLGI